MVRFSYFALAMFLPFAAFSEDAMKTGTMTVHGEAIIKIAPDELTLPVTVHEENASMKEAKDRHDQKLRALLKLAADTGIAKDKIQTNSTAVNPVYDYIRDNTHPRLRGYAVETELDFKLDDFSKLGNFMNGIIAAGIDTIGSVSYALQDESKVKDDVLNLAMKNAFAKASRLAATAQVTLDKPLVIDEGESDVQRPMPPRTVMRFAPMAAAQAAPPELPSGVIEIHQSVTVTYQLK